MCLFLSLVLFLIIDLPIILARIIMRRCEFLGIDRGIQTLLKANDLGMVAKHSQICYPDVAALRHLKNIKGLNIIFFSEKPAKMSLTTKYTLRISVYLSD